MKLVTLYRGVQVCLECVLVSGRVFVLGLLDEVLIYVQVDLAVPLLKEEVHAHESIALHSYVKHGHLVWELQTHLVQGRESKASAINNC